MKHIERLVVIGNGMAGGRFVEELTGRNGQEHFDVVVFGEEPLGNKTASSLWGVVPGPTKVKDIFLNWLRGSPAIEIRFKAEVRAAATIPTQRLVFGPVGSR